MPISTNDLIDRFGTQDTVTTGTPASIAGGAFSLSGDVAAWTNDENAPLAQFVLDCQWATVTGVANRRVVLYSRLLDIDGANDAVAPSPNRKWQPIGAFNVSAASANTDYWFDSGLCRLPNASANQKYEFYLENASGQTISAGWVLKITPITQGISA